jgi:beta-N-acetylglucosaminidase
MLVKEALGLDLKTPSSLTAEQINYFLKNCPLAGLGQSFIANEKNNRVNARYFCAHAIHESDWGRSRIAQEQYMEIIGE